MLPEILPGMLPPRYWLPQFCVLVLSAKAVVLSTQTCDFPVFHILKPQMLGHETYPQHLPTFHPKGDSRWQLGLVEDRQHHVHDFFQRFLG